MLGQARQYLPGLPFTKVNFKTQDAVGIGMLFSYQHRSYAHVQSFEMIKIYVWLARCRASQIRADLISVGVHGLGLAVGSVLLLGSFLVRLGSLGFIGLAGVLFHLDAREKI